MYEKDTENGRAWKRYSQSIKTNCRVILWWLIKISIDFAH